jgi:uncharacterized protein YjiS (DUF1127 family)
MSDLCNTAWLRRGTHISICNSSPYLTVHIVGCGSFRIAALRESPMLFTLMEIYRDWRRYNADLSELRSLSDRELADIGISRADIYRVAWEKASKAA